MNTQEIKELENLRNRIYPKLVIYGKTQKEKSAEIKVLYVVIRSKSCCLFSMTNELIKVHAQYHVVKLEPVVDKGEKPDLRITPFVVTILDRDNN